MSCQGSVACYDDIIMFVYVGCWAKIFLGWLVEVDTTLRSPLKAFIVIALRVRIDTY